jgi:prophage regulatory protein
MKSPQISQPARPRARRARSVRILKKPEVLARCGVSDTTLWRMEQRGEFPQHLKLSPRRVGWLESEIESWIVARSKDRSPSAA